VDENPYDRQKSSLDPELFIDPPALDWVVPQPLIETVALGRFDDMRGEDLKREMVRFSGRGSQT